MTTAREEAKRLFDSVDFDNGGNYNSFELRDLKRRLFVQGAEWQAQQPVEITDEMQDIALGIARQKLQEYSPLTHEPALGRLVDDIAMTVLEAVLGGNDG